MSRNPKAEIGPQHGLAVIVWTALDSDTWVEFGNKLSWALKEVTNYDSPRKLRRLIRSFWPSDG